MENHKSLFKKLTCISIQRRIITQTWMLFSFQSMQFKFLNFPLCEFFMNASYKTRGFFLTSESWQCKFHSARRKCGYLLGFFNLKGSNDRNILINSSGGKIRYWYKQKAEVYFRKCILKVSVIGAKQCNASWKNIMSCNFFNIASD